MNTRGLNGRSPIRFLGPQWFAPVMGWAGLGLALVRGEALLGEVARGAAYVAAAVSLVTFGLVLLASVGRIVSGHLDALQQDLEHPVRQAFVSTLPVSLLLIATLCSALGLGGFWAAPTWLAGAMLQVAVTVWLVGRWFRDGLAWPAMTPVVFIPVVGNVIVALGVPQFDQPGLATAVFGIGALAWPVVLALILARSAVHPLPERLAPTWFIAVAPPAVIGVDLLNLGAPHVFSVAAYGAAAFFCGCAVLLVPRLARLEFGMPFWAMSFPLAAFSSLGLALAERGAVPALIALAALASTTAVIVWLSIKTLQGLVRGTLLVAEPAAGAATGR